ncbi:MAG: hypothetical protein ACKVQK_08115 [Burkholderiales bacterium]
MRSEIDTVGCTPDAALSVKIALEFTFDVIERREPVTAISV